MWTIPSTATIEGNSLTKGDTVELLENGIAAGGKPYSHHMEIVDHYDVTEQMYELSKTKQRHQLRFGDIRTAHENLLAKLKPHSAGVVRGNPARPLGGSFYYPSPQKMSILIEELNNWLESTSEDDHTHPAKTAADLHYKIATMHPFGDGNGRLSRMFCNVVLQQSMYSPAKWDRNERERYISILEDIQLEAFEKGTAKEEKWDAYYQLMYGFMEKSLDMWLEDIDVHTPTK
eukprot:TRINITY_DN1678_c0_g1_i3.p1 TRINITY_DN1678_c0_g1~~TRINITY_DN1678_c0_g1_i3.p1  ORF type:complete len:232 (-),score=54.45 TRINITY_DN1678_c0_g1_i3:409-1104(-)